jgi:hypothetical protein
MATPKDGEETNGFVGEFFAFDHASASEPGEYRTHRL